MNKAIELDPKSHELWNDLGTFFIHIADDKMALDCFRSAHLLNPKNIQTLKNLGVIYANYGESAGVEKAISMISAISPQDGEDFSEKARALLKQARS